MTSLTPCFEYTKSFLTALDRLQRDDLFWVVIAESAQALQFARRRVELGQRPGNCYHYRGPFDAVRDRLASNNAKGYGVFLCVNDIRRGLRRRAGDVVRAGPLVQDDDHGHGPIAGVPATVTVETSPGKRQRWYRTPGGLSLEHWDAWQRVLALHHGNDPACTDRPRVLRVPGFWHQKRDPFLVSLVDAETSGAEVDPAPLLPAGDSLESYTGARGRMIRGRATSLDAVWIDSADPVLAALQDAGLVLGDPEIRQGAAAVPITCPWAELHTNADGLWDAAYWPAQMDLDTLDDAEGGGWHCFHESCRAEHSGFPDDLASWLTARGHLDESEWDDPVEGLEFVQGGTSPTGWYPGVFAHHGDDGSILSRAKAVLRTEPTVIDQQDGVYTLGADSVWHLREGRRPRVVMRQLAVRHLPDVENVMDWSRFETAALGLMSDAGDRARWNSARVAFEGGACVDFGAAVHRESVVAQPLAGAHWRRSVRPFTWSPGARCPKVDRFLLDTFEGDEDRIRLWWQWAGGCLVPNYGHHHRLMCMVGAPRAGKSTLHRLLAYVLGAEEVASSTFMALGESFGLAQLIKRRVLVVTEQTEQTSAGPVVAQGLARLLALTGHDPVSVNVKNSAEQTRTLPLHCMFVSNEVPAARDEAGALLERALMLPFNRMVPRAERDSGLDRRLQAESAGVVQRMLEGLEDIVSRGWHFTEPAVGAEHLDAMRQLNAPFRSCCEAVFRVTHWAEHFVSRDEARDAIESWYSDQGWTAPNPVRMGRELRKQMTSGALVGVREERPRASSKVAHGSEKQVRGYVGLQINREFQEFSADVTPIHPKNPPEKS